MKIMKKKPKKGGKDAKPQIKTEKIESFFNFFSPPEVRSARGGLGDRAVGACVLYLLAPGLFHTLAQRHAGQSGQQPQ